jgi:hypothetical protein
MELSGGLWPPHEAFHQPSQTITGIGNSDRMLA